MKKITISYFPTGLKFCTPLLAGGAIYLGLNDHIVWSVILVLLAVIILTTDYVTEINLKEKKYRDYLSFLGLKVNEDAKTFNQLDRIVITKGNYAHTANTRVQTRTVAFSDYTATLLHDRDGSLDLLTRNDKMELLRGLKEFVSFLKVDVEDNTSSEPYWIDMTKI